MKNLIILLASIISLLINTQLSANNYVWLHGDKNDDNCWKIFDESLTSGISSRVKYTFSNNAKTTSENVWTNYNLNNKSDNVLIGYSLGGLIAREIEYNHSSKIKGIITMGTPQNGVANINGGICASLEGYTSFRARLRDAMDATAYTTVPIVGNVIVNIVFDDSETKYIKNLPYYTSNQTLRTTERYSTLEKDLLENSSYMKSVENRTVKVPILCFAAEEDRWQLGRMLHCSRYMTDLQTNSSLNTDGNFDKAGYDQLNTMANNCVAMGVTHTVLATGSAVAAFYWLPAAILAATNTVAAVAWYDADSYINNKLDYNQAINLGAYRTDRIDTYHKVLFVKWTTSEYVNVPEGHDGFASVKSQYLATNKGTNVIIPAASIKNVNHMEEFNHKNTRAEFNKAIVLGGYKPETFQK